MGLFLHLTLHVLLAVVAGLIAWKIFKANIWLSLLAGIAGGVAVDLDHYIDYVIAFGWGFDLQAFVSGNYFLKNDKFYILFHGWEYVILFIVLAWFWRQKKILSAVLLALAIGHFNHLVADVVLNDIPARAYSLGYRIKHDFAIQYLVEPEHYQRDQQRRKELNL